MTGLSECPPRFGLKSVLDAQQLIVKVSDSTFCMKRICFRRVQRSFVYGSKCDHFYKPAFLPLRYCAIRSTTHYTCGGRSERIGSTRREHYRKRQLHPTCLHLAHNAALYTSHAILPTFRCRAASPPWSTIRSRQSWRSVGLSQMQRDPRAKPRSQRMAEKRRKDQYRWLWETMAGISCRGHRVRAQIVPLLGSRATLVGCRTKRNGQGKERCYGRVGLKNLIY